jgi:hypothetical protein
MTKTQMLDALENAKQTHLAQMDKIKAVIAGKEVKHPTALGKMECECGIWFYSHEEQMKQILGLQLFERLDRSHENWHRDYVSIYEIYFKEEKKGFFAKILGTNKVDDLQRDKAKLYFVELQKDTEELLAISEAAIRRVSALNDSKFV